VRPMVALLRRVTILHRRATASPLLSNSRATTALLHLNRRRRMVRPRPIIPDILPSTNRRSSRTANPHRASNTLPNTANRRMANRRMAMPLHRDHLMALLCTVCPAHTGLPWELQLHHR
jgi:hypothetical protein